MCVAVNFCKCYKTKDAESGSGFYRLVIPFTTKALSLKTDNFQEFTLHVSKNQKCSTYKFKAYIFAKSSLNDGLEWEKKMQKVVKMRSLIWWGELNLVEAVIKGDALIH
eukprot:15310479-Ditylum_brightwellii.AAC.1